MKHGQAEVTTGGSKVFAKPVTGNLRQCSVTGLGFEKISVVDGVSVVTSK